MLYLVGALTLYAHAVLTLRQTPPQDARDGLSVLLLCTVLAAMWPLVVMWSLAAGTADE